jgi:hypothetical protein
MRALRRRQPRYAVQHQPLHPRRNAPPPAALRSSRRCDGPAQCARSKLQRVHQRRQRIRMRRDALRLRRRMLMPKPGCIGPAAPGSRAGKGRAASNIAPESGRLVQHQQGRALPVVAQVHLAPATLHVALTGTPRERAYSSARRIVHGMIPANQWPGRAVSASAGM